MSGNKKKPIYLPRMQETIFNLMRTYPRFWSPDEIEETISESGDDTWTAANIEAILRHHSDFARFARVPACDLCNPLKNKTQTCRHPSFHYAYKILLKGIAVLEQHEKRQGEKETDNDDTEQPDQN